jgi:tRNA modification GTPase
MALPPLNDTIAAIATAPGVGAVGIIRLSGRDAYRIADNLFKPRHGKCVKDLPAGRVVYGQILDGETVIDEALLLTFRAPHSYTAQDVLEFQTHGGPAVLREVLDLCVKHGARLAQPGEFTLRAYLNGRLDLVQAESVLQLVNAQSDSARRNATLGLSKALTQQLNIIQDDITRVYGNIQAMFDYPDEGVPEAEFSEPLQRAVKRIDELLATAKAGQIAQKGAKLALIGKPNAGKSSLLNALLGYQRSIVSEIPGTTRDYLEAPLSIEGIPITAIDTAGLRNTEDIIEAAGVKVARDIAANADLTLYLIDSHETLSADDVEMLGFLAKERTLVVSSKADLEHVWNPEQLAQKVYSVSAVTGEGLPELKAAIKEKLLGDVGTSQLWITSERHTQALQKTRDFLLQAMTTSDDLAALDLEQALKALAEITGRGEIAEETLEHIFANFCVGK